MHDKPTVLSKSVSRSASASPSPSDDGDDKEYVGVPSVSKTLSSVSPTSLLGLTTDEIVAFYRGGRYGQPPRNKHFQDYQTLATITSGSSQLSTSITSIPQGTLSNGRRLGQQIRVRSVNIRFRIKWQQNAVSPGTNVGITTSLQPVRIVIFSDRMPLAGAPSWAEDVNPAVSYLSLVNTLGAGSSNNTVAPFNINTHGTRYKILHDKIIHPKGFLEAANGTTVSAAAQVCHEYHATGLNHMISWYDNNSTTFVENPIEFFIMSDLLDNTYQTPSPNYCASWDIMFDDVTVP